MVDEAGSFFHRNYAKKGEVGSDNFKPEVMLSFRTGAPPARRLLKHKNKKPLEASQVCMCVMSQFAAARAFIVELVRSYSLGWAQGFTFTFSEDKPLLWEDYKSSTMMLMQRVMIQFQKDECDACDAGDGR